MTTSPPVTTPPAPSATGSQQRGPLRLSLRSPGHGHPVDGAWHPRSGDLGVEAADLVDHFPASAGRVARLLYSRPDWDAAPGAPGVRKVTTARGPVKVGSFPRDDTHLMVLRLSVDHALRILVVPHGVDDERGARILARAAADDNTLTAPQLLAQPDEDDAVLLVV